MLEDILQQRKNEGNRTIPLSEEGLSQLENLPFALMRSNSPAAEVAPATPPQRSVTPPPTQPAQPPQPVKAPQPPVQQPTPQPAPPAAAPVPAAQPVAAHPLGQGHGYGDLAVKVEQRNQVEVIFPAGDSIRDRLNNLFRIVKQDAGLLNVPTLRDQLVFASGDPSADMMFVGEAPGEEEENQKKPFVGPAGQKLEGIIKAMGLSRDKVYISNILKYRPKIGDGRFQGPKNRLPTPEEMAMSVKYVRSEIEVIKPKIIVALGATAAEGLLDIAGSASSMRGKDYQIDGIPVIVTYHPSYLIRLEDEQDKQRVLGEKRKVWEDMLRAMEKIAMPISDAQRGFFTK